MQSFNAELCRRSGHLSSITRVSVASMMLIREWLMQFSWRTKKMIREEREFLSEDPTNSVGNTGYQSGGATGTLAGFDPVLISLIRRSMPNLVAYDLAGVQPMNGPTGLIFAMRSRFNTQGGTEALFDEADTAFSAQDSGFDTTQGDYTAGTSI